MPESWFALPGLILWIGIFFLPWRPWSTRESLDAEPEHRSDLSGVTVLIPARNEAETIARTLKSVSSQGNIYEIILVDDQSTDDTGTQAKQTGLDNLRIIHGCAVPENWNGKLWALQQGLPHVNTEYILLLDADIELLPGTLSVLLRKSVAEDLALVSLMAKLRMQTLWEKMLMPAFVYFFKLLYPFSLSNNKTPVIAAAAGGCILIKTGILNEIGGFHALKSELIDDCSLARKVKGHGGNTWIGLTHSAVSHREYNQLSQIWNMVTRTAFTQLRYSVFLLFLCTLLLIAAFIFPFIAVLGPAYVNQLAGIVTFLLIWGTYIPLIRYYSINTFWVLILPIAGIMYLIMTWNSAWRHWNGKSAVWKERIYTRQK